MTSSLVQLRFEKLLTKFNYNWLFQRKWVNENEIQTKLRLKEVKRDRKLLIFLSEPEQNIIVAQMAEEMDLIKWAK